MRGRARDLLLLLVGGVAGYLIAVNTRVGRAPLPTDLPRKAEAYYRTHPNETIVGAVLLAVIVLLLATRKGGRARR